MKQKACKKNYMLRAAIGVFVLLFFLFPLKVKAAVTENDVEADFTKEAVYVRTNDHADLYFAFSAEGKTVAESRFIRVLPGVVVSHTFRDGTTEDAFVLDLSALKTTKVNVLHLRYDLSETAYRYSIPAQLKLKAVYRGTEETEGIIESMYGELTDGVNTETGYFKFTLNDTTDLTDLSGIRWRAGSGTNFKSISELKLEMYLNSGATLYFTYTDGTVPLSKVVKVKLKKVAKAPTIKVDGDKLTLAIKGKMEYRIVTDSSSGEWISPDADAKCVLIKDIDGLSGEGNYYSFDTTEIEVRVAATEKAHASNTAIVTLDAVALPDFSDEGIVITYASADDLTKGMIVTNNSAVDYQYTVVEAGAWSTTSTVKLIQQISGTAKNGETGYVKWKKVAAGKTSKIAYKDYSEMDDYLILVRRATVKEDKSTDATEFRVASAIRPYGGIVPTPDNAGATYLLSGSESKTVEINFAAEEGFTLYTAVGNAAYAVNESNKVSITGSAGDIIKVKAYFIDSVNGESSTVKVFNYRFVADGELEAYANEWRYHYYRTLDNQNWALLYQRVYLGILTYDTVVKIDDIADMSVEDNRKKMIEVINSVYVDNPELIQFKRSYTYSTTEVVLHLYDKDLCDQLYAECETSLNTIKANIKEKYGDNPTKIQIVKEIHDYMVLYKQYESSDMDQTMAGALSAQYTPVCMSYALGFKWCCDELGVQCVVATGYIPNQGGHAWNILQYGDIIDYSSAESSAYVSSDWYEMDVTWDDPLGASESYIGYSNFNITTAQRATSRTRDTDARNLGPVTECTGTTYSYDKCVSNGSFGD